MANKYELAFTDLYGIEEIIDTFDTYEKAEAEYDRLNNELDPDEECAYCLYVTENGKTWREQW